VFDGGAAAMEAGGIPGQGASMAQHLAHMQKLIAQLRPLHDQYRKGWNAFYQQLSGEISRLPGPAQKVAVTFLEREFPSLGGEEQFRALAQAQQVSLTGPASAAMAAGQMLNQLVAYFLPGRKNPDTASDIQLFVQRIAQVLETFSQSFVGLRKGYNQFGTEMALGQAKSFADPTPIDSAEDPKAVMGYLLDWQADGSRVQELTSAYADIMIHQVALLNGLMEGVRDLLNQRLGPKKIEADAAGAPSKASGIVKALRFMWPFSAVARWQQYVEEHKEITEEDRGLTTVVLGPKFQRTYLEMMGESLPSGGAGAKQLPNGGR